MSRFDRGLAAKSIYLGIKLHFSSKSYDWSKYGPKKIKRRAFEASSDKFMFMRLGSASDEDVLEIVLAATIENNGNTPWVGELLDPKWRKLATIRVAKRHAFEKHFSDEVDKTLEELGSDHSSWLDGDVPKLARLVMRKVISPDTFCVMAEVFGGLDDVQSTDEILWPTFKSAMDKYRCMSARLSSATAARIMRNKIERKIEMEKYENERNRTGLRQADERVGQHDHREDAGAERPRELDL